LAWKRRPAFTSSKGNTEIALISAFKNFGTTFSFKSLDYSDTNKYYSKFICSRFYWRCNPQYNCLINMRDQGGATPFYPHLFTKILLNWKLVLFCCLWRRWSCHFYWILIWIEIQGVIKYCAERNCRRKKSIRTPSEVLGESVLSYQVVKNWSRDHKVGREFYEHTLDVRQRRTIVWFKKTLIWSTMSFSKMDESQWNSYQSAQLNKHSCERFRREWNLNWRDTTSSKFSYRHLCRKNRVAFISTGCIRSRATGFQGRFYDQG
jgi:hypothetical protein